MKTRHFNIPALALATSVAASSSALAAFDATAVTDLNVRSGPGPQYNVVGVINADQGATVQGCLKGSKWCKVISHGTEGWAYSDYLMTDFSGQRVAIANAPSGAEVPVVTYDETNTAIGAGTGALTGALAGALIGGPVGAAVGGVAGAAVGTAAAPPKEVNTYVVAHKTDPVYLEGEVVIGARAPDTVTLHPVPGSTYSYVYLNGQPVVIDPHSRTIVHVYR